MTGHPDLWVLGLLVAVAGLVKLANLLGVPYPVVLVLGRLALEFVRPAPRGVAAGSRAQRLQASRSQCASDSYGQLSGAISSGHRLSNSVPSPTRQSVIE